MPDEVRLEPATLWFKADTQLIKTLEATSLHGEKEVQKYVINYFFYKAIRSRVIIGLLFTHSGIDPYVPHPQPPTEPCPQHIATQLEYFSASCGSRTRGCNVSVSLLYLVS